MRNGYRSQQREWERKSDRDGKVKKDKRKEKARLCQNCHGQFSRLLQNHVLFKTFFFCFQGKQVQFRSLMVRHLWH
jgi:hypothetical protein